MKKYPKKILEITEEAPIGYGIILLDDYKKGKITVAQAVKNWKKEKAQLALDF